MKFLPVTIDLEIPNDIDKLYDYAKRVLANILEHVELDVSQQQRIKLILVELVTNSIKHTSDPNTQLQLIIDHPHLSIQKMEKGLQIQFSASSPQIPFENIDHILKISFSQENKHQIQPLDQYRFRFLNPFKDEGLSIDHMPEHFGLYIITLASDSFIYQYDPQLKENRYIVNIDL
ncbi:ATP-binding protein [Pedobacter metabolipauper]|uniref:Histidine kinase/HSP90-like ATPase domain-containing protein n=1 Tax=Pedobacter metabolipauper TaxID=425513 RepID=A0A4R6T0P1_9SPHI|nr:ATP-binding protein [Pedobacter metabolipauper]TDQ11992.1 hypothetical protein ATK78_1122 [Pedobacter metabolipauper]